MHFVFRLSRRLLFGLLLSVGLGMSFATLNQWSSIADINKIKYSAISSILLMLSFGVRERGKDVHIIQEGKVYEYYMYIWKVFYACYVLLPFLK